MTDDELITEAQSLIYFAAARKSPGWKWRADKWQKAYRERKKAREADTSAGPA